MTLQMLAGSCSDEVLTRRIAEGDHRSLGVLFDRYHADVRRFVVRLGCSESDADDLVQQTFLQVIKTSSRYDGRASARPWLLGIAAMMVRKHRHSLLRVLRRFVSRDEHDHPAPLPSPAELLELSERGARAARALAKLSPKKREVFVMVVIEGTEGEAVAAALGIPLATVWTRLHYARRELRAHLSEDAS